MPRHSPFGGGGILTNSITIATKKRVAENAVANSLQLGF